jgi:hypothetical protein
VQDSVSARFWKCIQELSGSNLGRYTGCPEWECRLVSTDWHVGGTSLLRNVGQNLFISNPFSFQQSSWQDRTGNNAALFGFLWKNWLFTTMCIFVLKTDTKQNLQFLPYGRSIGSRICLTHKTYTCHTVHNTYSASMAVSDSQSIFRFNLAVCHILPSFVSYQGCVVRRWVFGVPWYTSLLYLKFAIQFSND